MSGIAGCSEQFSVGVSGLVKKKNLDCTVDGFYYLCSKKHRAEFAYYKGAGFLMTRLIIAT